MNNTVILFFAGIALGLNGLITAELAGDLEDLAGPELLGITDLIPVGAIDEWPER